MLKKALQAALKILVARLRRQQFKRVMVVFSVGGFVLGFLAGILVMKVLG